MSHWDDSRVDLYPLHVSFRDTKKLVSFYAVRLRNPRAETLCSLLFTGYPEELGCHSAIDGMEQRVKIKNFEADASLSMPTIIKCQSISGYYTSEWMIKQCLFDGREVFHFEVYMLLQC